MKRRNFLRAMMAAPMAARKVAETSALALMNNYPQEPPRVGFLSSFGSDLVQGTTGVMDVPKDNVEQNRLLSRGMAQQLIRAAMQVPDVRRSIESDFYRMHRRIFTLDPDLAANRSYSLAAKIVYQRQRNVAREMDEEFHQPASMWHSLRGKLSRILYPLRNVTEERGLLG